MTMTHRLECEDRLGRWGDYFRECCCGLLFKPSDLLALGEYMDQQEADGCEDYSAMAGILQDRAVKGF
jgi:hypothetical protein